MYTHFSGDINCTRRIQFLLNEGQWVDMAHQEEPQPNNSTVVRISTAGGRLLTWPENSCYLSIAAEERGEATVRG